jgi:hypothetical protein
LKAASALSPPPPISPKADDAGIGLDLDDGAHEAPQCAPFEWRSGASSGTVTVVARISVIFGRFMPKAPLQVLSLKSRSARSR